MKIFSLRVGGREKEHEEENTEAQRLIRSFSVACREEQAQSKTSADP